MEVIMKLCRQCNVEKELSGFYAHPRMPDGYLNKCKECVKTRVKKHRVENIEKILAYDRKRNMRPDRVAARKKYIQTDVGKAAKKRAMDSYAKRYPMAYAARVIFGNAVRDKRVERKTICSICESTIKVEGHHDDYTKPLEVRWLCEKCHKTWHKFNKPIYE
jgi:ribosomal protein S27AE